MKKIILIIAIFLVTTVKTFAHPLLPQEVVDFIEQHPDATEQEVEIFFTENFGPLEDYYGLTNNERDWNLKELYLPSNEMIEDLIRQSQSNPSLENAKLFLSAKQGNLTFWENMKAFIVLGIEHILGGLDHVLFVIALILILPPGKKF